MGLNGISPGSLLIICLLIAIFFGGQRLRNFGSDLGAAIKNFKKSSSNNNNLDNKP